MTCGMDIAQYSASLSNSPLNAASDTKTSVRDQLELKFSKTFLILHDGHNLHFAELHLPFMLSAENRALS